MQELTQQPRDNLRENPEHNRIVATQLLDFEKDKLPLYHRQKDILSQLCSIENDMKGASGSIEGLFGMKILPRTR